jgi:hypothetical protein
VPAKDSGAARMTWRYDEHGNKVEMAYFGADGQLVPAKDGAARVTACYDEHVLSSIRN